MIYPKKIKAKESNKLIKILLITSILMAIMIKIINIITTPNIPWAELTIAGIIYTWITVIYSIRRNINIAGHVLLQTILVSIFTVYIDYEFGFKGWSINIAIPIMIIISNITMLTLTVVSHRKYIKYAIYQLIIVIFSMLPLIFIKEHMINNKILGMIASLISIINLIVTLFLSANDLKEVIIRKFHI